MVDGLLIKLTSTTLDSTPSHAASHQDTTQSTPTMSARPISLHCHCKAITLTIPNLPRHLNECHCSICRRYGVQWGYFDASQVTITTTEPDATETYVWGDKEITFHRCRKCGCVTHWLPIDESLNRLGVNGRLLEKKDLEKLAVKHTRRNAVDYDLSTVESSDSEG